MRFQTQKLLIFLGFTRLLILVLPWLTITLLFPESRHLNFIQFTEISWARWDALHYIYLATHWYTNIGDAANFIVFFPLYPLLLKSAFAILGNSTFIAIIISSILYIAGSYVFYKLVQIDYPEKVARAAVIALAIFPTSYFFNAPYTESLFLLLFSAAFFYARKEKWVWSALITALACITRPFGLLVLPAILVEWYFAKNRKWKYLPVIILPAAIAIVSYLYLNQHVYGNAFEFEKILGSHWQKHLVSPLTGILSSWKITFSGGLTSFVILVGWAEAITSTISWILIPFTFKYLRRSWAVFYTLSVIAFSSTSFILSGPRYLLSIPPLFVLIALAEKNYLFKTVWRFASIALLFCLATLFTRGQWAF